MSKTPSYWNKAKKYLSKKDKVMSSLIKKYKSPSETVLTSRRDVFFSLCKSIVGQQISVAAANAVFFKFKKKCKNKINPKTVIKLSNSQLKDEVKARIKYNNVYNKKIDSINKKKILSKTDKTLYKEVKIDSQSDFIKIPSNTKIKFLSVISEGEYRDNENKNLYKIEITNINTKE